MLTLLLYLLEYIHYRGLLMNKAGFYAKYKTAFLKHNQFNFLVLGSSRAEMHYNTRFIDSLWHVNAFNLGMTGASPEMTFRTLRAYSKKSKAPKQIIYEFDINNINDYKKEINDFNNYFPFLYADNFFDEFVKVEPRYRWFKWLPYYSLPYCGLKNFSTSIHGLTHKPNKNDENYYKGYVATTGVLNIERIKESKAIMLNKKNGDYLDSIIRFCKSHSIQIFVVTSPIFMGGHQEFSNKRVFVEKIRRRFNGQGVKYFDFSELNFVNDSSFFLDRYHMNARGADKFTKMLCDSLRL